MDQVNKKSISGKLIFTVFILGFCWASNYLLAFIQYTLYDPFKEVIGATNTQLGLLMTIYGLGNVFGAPIGGWLADRFNYKKIFVASLIGNGLLSIYFAFNMSYTTALFVWVGLAVTGLLMNYPSHIKIVRMLVDEESQGKIFGLNEAFVGVGSIVSSTVVLFIFSKFAGEAMGMKMVILFMAFVSFACGIAAWFIVPSPDKNEGTKSEGNKENMTVRDFIKVLTSPATWIVGIGIFAVYSFTVTMSYFTPYFTAVSGLSITLAGTLALIRNYGLKFVGGPIGGWIADKIKSSSKVLILVYIVGIAVLLTILLMPTTTPVWIIVVITLFIALIVFMGRGVFYAVASEINIPREYSASTVGIAAALGFSPDLFQFTLFGGWMDKYGNDGYKYMFIYQIIILAIGLLGSLYALKYKKNLKETNIEQ